MAKKPSFKQRVLNHLNEGNHKNWELYVFMVFYALLTYAIERWGS